MEEMEQLVDAAGDMFVTLHRALMYGIHMRPSKQAKRLGISLIWTSGQKNSCLAGKELLRELGKHGK